MAKLLRIDASARIKNSRSRILGDHAQMLWRQANPDGCITMRDLADGKIQILNGETINGYYALPSEMTPELKAAVAQSNELIAELKCADTLLITTPMYNFSIPAALKAWVDQISRNGQTFLYEGEDYRGLLKANQAIIVCTYGTAEFQTGAKLVEADFLQPYLRFLLNSLGIGKINFIAAHGTSNPETVENSLSTAKAELDLLFKSGAHQFPE